ARLVPLRLAIAAACLAGCTVEPQPPEDPAIASATAEPRSVSQADLTVELNREASIAGACVRRDDPAEVHLLEATGSGTQVLRFAGLLASTDYDCTVAVVPGTGSEPESVAHASFRTPDPQGELASADATGDPSRMTGAYTVMNVKPECYGGKTNYITVLDPDGNNRWRHDLPDGMNIGLEVTSDGPNRFLWGGGKDPRGAPTVVDVLDGDQWTLAFPGSDRTEFHHETRRLADGTVLSAEDAYDDGWAAFKLRISRDDGTPAWLWDVRDAVADGWLPAGSAEVTDPHHLNWADVVDSGAGPVAYASLCYAFLIVAIDVTTNQPLWRFGAGGDFTLTDAAGDPLPDEEYPQCQHGLQTDGTHLIVYDNGTNRGYTRVVEYELDQRAMTAKKVWDWRDEGFWELYHGGVDWLTPDRDRVLIAEGNNDCGEGSDRPSQVVELERSTGAEIHRLTFRDVGQWLYRAHRVDGCDVFANTKYCPTLAARLDQLRPALGL
ncbi:MAG: aryl-sulfate sulfotransferase, partial [Myxococcota bacterium]